MKRKDNGTPSSQQFEYDSYDNMKREIDMLIHHVKMLEEQVKYYEKRIHSLEMKALQSFIRSDSYRNSIDGIVPTIGDMVRKYSTDQQ